MGKRIIPQRRGKGSPTYEAKNSGTQSRYAPISPAERETKREAQIVGLFKESGRDTILMQVVFDDGATETTIAPEGVFVGQRLNYGKEAPIEIGNAVFLSKVPEGSPICNIELVAGDGGKLVRSTGGYAMVMTKDERHAFLKLPSGKTIKVGLECRATIGNVSGSGRPEKPLVKAGAAHHRFKARSRMYPRVRGVAMNPLNHPFGGSAHHAGKSKSTARNAPPGRKVGAIASSRTGRRQK